MCVLAAVAGRHLRIVNDEGLYALPPCGIFLPRLERPCAKIGIFGALRPTHAFQEDCTIELRKTPGEPKTARISRPDQIHPREAAVPSRIKSRHIGAVSFTIKRFRRSPVMATQEASALRGNQFNPMLVGVPSQLTAVPEMMAPSVAERERIARLEKL